VHTGFEADQLGATLEQQVLTEAVTPVHLQREPAEVAQLLLTEAQERAPFAPKVARRRSRPSSSWRSGRDGSAGHGLLSQQSLQERDAHHAPSLLTASERERSKISAAQRPFRGLRATSIRFRGCSSCAS